MPGVMVFSLHPHPLPVARPVLKIVFDMVRKGRLPVVMQVASLPPLCMVFHLLIFCPPPELSPALRYPENNPRNQGRCQKYCAQQNMLRSQTLHEGGAPHLEKK